MPPGGAAEARAVRWLGTASRAGGRGPARCVATGREDDRDPPYHVQAADLAALLQSWMDDEDDGGEQRETGEYLVRTLDQDRLSGRQLFPGEHMGVTW